MLRNALLCFYTTRSNINIIMKPIDARDPAQTAKLIAVCISAIDKKLDRILGQSWNHRKHIKADLNTLLTLLERIDPDSRVVEIIMEPKVTRKNDG